MARRKFYLSVPQTIDDVRKHIHSGLYRLYDEGRRNTARRIISESFPKEFVSPRHVELKRELETLLSYL